MSFEYLTNLPLDEARQKYLAQLKLRGVSHKVEKITTTEALDRVCAEAVYANISAPHYNACAMDGVALNARLTFGASETAPVHIREGDFTWVNTGDPLPEGCDAVVMVEDVIEGDGFITLRSTAIPWEHIRQIGEDISAGDMVLPSFTQISPAAIGALLAAGVMEINVVTRPVVGIIPTGDELVPLTPTPRAGEIIEFNSSIFAGMLQQWGCVARKYPIAGDTLDGISGALQLAAAECDAVILIAGSSAGKKDHAAQAMRSLGEVIVHGIAIKPGKPAILAVSNQTDVHGAVPLLGVPGYPVSGIIVMEQVFKPVIEMLTCRAPLQPAFLEATISRRLNSTLKYKEYIRATLGKVGGKVIAVPLNRGAGVVSSFVKADGIIQIPQNAEGYEPGEKVPVRLLRGLDEIERSLLITGSHDPLLDEIADIFKRQWPGNQVSSSHVGSMGAILALKRGEAHLGGIHLLDEASGEYNIPYLRRYFNPGDVVLVECVQRTQGLMVSPGNPGKIKGLADLAGLRYVNRQKGSGTRILFDYLLNQLALNPAVIEGYEREEFTHTAVAASIAAGTADAGLGIYSVAKAFRLDFVPIAAEQYDLLILQDALKMEMVQKLLEILQSQEFARRLEKLGGYTLAQPGEVRPWR